MPRARHILHDQIGLARNMLAHVLRQDPSPLIVQRSRRRADIDGNSLAFVEIGLRKNGARADQARGKSERARDETESFSVNAHKISSPVVSRQT